MEKYLDRCLSSLVVCNIDQLIQCLEVLVVIDGSTDGSIDIACKYESRYSGVFRVIKKENGNYGSCINRGLKEALGVYVKILDADDWFNTDVFRLFINDLEDLIKKDMFPDIIQTPFTSIGKKGQKEVIRYNTMGLQPYQYGKVYALDSILKEGYIRFFLMHGIAYRTEMLNKMDYSQMEGISYTDTQWACYPIYKAETIVFLNHNLYQYEAFREGQTMDPKVLMKSLLQLRSVTDSMLDYYDKHVDEKGVSTIRKAWLKQYHTNRIRVMYKHYLLDMPREDFDYDVMQEMDNHYCQMCAKYDFNVVLLPENKLLRIDYIKYWHKYHHRWPVWLETLNSSFDFIMKSLYRVIIRR